jgi:hypothetical protein
MKKYALYDTYETETEPGELLCTSDDYAEEFLTLCEVLNIDPNLFRKTA